MHKVLIVDDDRVVLKQLNIQLRDSGYETMIFENAQEALTAAPFFNPEIIISDIKMPDMDGFKFLAEVKKNNLLSKIPFLFLSGHADTDSKIKGFEMGADEFIVKPYEFKDLLVRLNLQIKLRSNSKYNYSLTGELKNKPLRVICDNLHTGRQSGLLRIVHNGETSFIGFKDGEIYSSASINRIGKHAFYYLMTLQNGKFKFTENEPVPTRNVLDSYDSLIPMAEKTAEIASIAYKKLSGKNRIVYVDPSLIVQLGASTDVKDYNLSKLLDHNNQTLFRVIDYSEYGILDIIKHLIAFIGQERIVVDK